MTLRYFKPALNGHKILYKGRRFWVFEVSKKFPFFGSEELDKIVVFDGVYNRDICWCHINEKGEFEGLVPHGQHTLSVFGETIKELVNDVSRTVRWCERN